jgi:signal transduction histidine kinase
VDGRIWDAILAVVLLAVGVLGFVYREPVPHEPPAVVGLLLTGAATVPLAWRRRAPLVVAGIVGGSVVVASVVGWWPEFTLPFLIALYTAAAHRDRHALVPVAVPLVVALAVAIGVGDMGLRGVKDTGWALEVLLACGLPILVGRATFNRRRRIIRERELAARNAVEAERARIARELHDVVAHHMSVMVVQAGAARAVAETDPEAASEALRQIESSGRAGLAEMRRLLEILKAGQEGDGRAPQPGLAHLDELLRGMNATGLPVEAVVEGSARSLPPGVDLSAYRIVQEALTNSLKHAPGARARVLLRYEPEALVLEVADDGPGPPADENGSGGHGLIGMRERAQLFGGELWTGPRPGGGFLVRARLPVDGEVPP